MLIESESGDSLHRILNIFWKNARHGPPPMWTFVIFDEFHWPLESSKAFSQFAGRVDQRVRGADDYQRPGPRRRERDKSSRYEGIRERRARVADIRALRSSAHEHVENVGANLHLGVRGIRRLGLHGERRDGNDATGRRSAGLHDEVCQHDRCSKALSVPRVVWVRARAH